MTLVFRGRQVEYLCISFSADEQQAWSHLPRSRRERQNSIYQGYVTKAVTVDVQKLNAFFAALMHSIYQRKPPIPALYVKAVYGAYGIRQVFLLARALSPCMLIWEDIETIVNYSTRSYFFNEVDGLENNSGIFMIASTNYRKPQVNTNHRLLPRGY